MSAQTQCFQSKSQLTHIIHRTNAHIYIYQQNATPIHIHTHIPPLSSHPPTTHPFPPECREPIVVRWSQRKYLHSNAAAARKGLAGRLASHVKHAHCATRDTLYFITYYILYKVYRCAYVNQGRVWTHSRWLCCRSSEWKYILILLRKWKRIHSP